MKKLTFVGFMIVLVSVSAISSFFGGSYIMSLDSDKNIPFDFNNSVSKLESQTKTNPLVADVNGQEIRLDEVKKFINAEMSQGQKLDSFSALDMIITKILLLEEAENRNIVITMDDAKKEMTDILSRQGLSQEEFDEKLADLDTTYDETLNLFREEMIINKILADEIMDKEIEISDDEVETFFEENIEMIKTQIGNTTVFEDISPQLRANLLQQKQQKMALDFIESLEQNAIIIKYEENLK